MLNLLFVYGTLRSEFDSRYARLLHSHAELVGGATVPGSIYRVRHFPAYRPEPPGEVCGELYRLSSPETTLAALDDYEGSDFDRLLCGARTLACRVETHLDTCLQSPTECARHAWIYQFKLQPPDRSRIASGDFCTP